MNIASAAGGSNFAEIRVAEVRDRIAQNRVVERVEHLESEVQALPLGERESFMQSGVVSERGRAAKNIIS